MSKGWPVALAALMVLSAFPACSSVGSTGGDCTYRVGFQGDVYRTHNAVNEAAPAGELLGEGDLLDCDGEALDHARVYAVRGVDSGLAIVVKAGPANGLYVLDGLSTSSFPEELREPVLYIGNQSGEELRIRVVDPARELTNRIVLPAGLAEGIRWPDCRAGTVVVDVERADGFTEVAREELMLCEGDAIDVDAEFALALTCVWYRRGRPAIC